LQGQGAKQLALLRASLCDMSSKAVFELAISYLVADLLVFLSSFVTEMLPEVANGEVLSRNKFLHNH
jgi:hypothetical protein